MKLEYKDWCMIPSDGFTAQLDGYIELTDDMRAKIIKKAHDLDAALVEFHSHPHPYDACFSWSDKMGFEEFVPHVWWRLKGKPYAAVVVAPENFDALIWISGPGKPQLLNQLVIESGILKPTGLTLKRWSDGYDFNKI